LSAWTLSLHDALPIYGKAPAFVGVAIVGRRADRECRHLIEEEIEPVIVVDHHGGVRLDAVEPAMGRGKAVEERRPVGILLQSLRSEDHTSELQSRVDL